jgi:hypothetical protein
MVSLLLGIAAAAAASTLYSLGIAVQALDARATDRMHSMRITLLAHLARQGRWLAGTAMTILGWPLQVLALLLAPLVVVQPALAAGLLVLLIAGQRMLGEHAGRREWLAVAAIVVGVAGIAALAPERTTTHTDRLTLVIVLASLGTAATLPYLLASVGRPLAGAMMIGAGFGFAWSALSTKLLADAISNGHWLTGLGWGLGSGAASAVAVISEMSALQRRPAIQVAPVVFVVQTIVPVAVAPFLLHERFLRDAATGVPMLACLGVLLSGAVVLARSPLLLALMAPQADAAETGTEPSLSADSSAESRSSPRSDAAEPSHVTTTTSPARSGR